MAKFRMSVGRCCCGGGGPVSDCTVDHGQSFSDALDGTGPTQLNDTKWNLDSSGARVSINTGTVSGQELKRPDGIGASSGLPELYLLSGSLPDYNRITLEATFNPSTTGGSSDRWNLRASIAFLSAEVRNKVPPSTGYEVEIGGRGASYTDSASGSQTLKIIDDIYEDSPGSYTVTTRIFRGGSLLKTGSISGLGEGSIFLDSCNLQTTIYSGYVGTPPSGWGIRDISVDWVAAPIFSYPTPYGSPTGSNDWRFSPMSNTINPIISGFYSPFTYAIKTGSLPMGVTLNTSTGVISGGAVGMTGSVSIEVTDANGVKTETPSYDWQVLP